jgi:hypothetical protein
MRLAILALTLAGILTGCSGGDAPTLAPNVTPQQQADAARSMGLTFPAGVQFLLYKRDTGGPDDAVFLKLAMSGPALAQFVAQPPLASVKWDSTRRCVDDVPTWPQWQPDKATQFRSAQIHLPSAEVLNVLIDDGAAAGPDGSAIVYLMWFQT